uniref:Nucleolar complex protein 2 homolog n=1 Tax=Davidia involucrata TaxID=16924 RepID=A0A5B7C525_DAVIN
MGKLGKKARKFAKKNLQSVLKRRRKTKTFHKKKSRSKDERDTVEDQVENTAELSNRRNPEGEDKEDISLDAIFSEDDSDVGGDASDSDGFLSEDSSCPHIAERETESIIEGNSSSSALLVQNREIHKELAKQKKKLDRLKEKDLEFSKFLESYKKGLEPFRNEEVFSDEDEMSNPGMQSAEEDGSVTNKGKILTSSAINSWCQLVMEEHRESVLTGLLNGYRAACHYGTESFAVPDAASCHRIQNSEAFCTILMFMLREADNIFRRLFKVSPSNCRKETILELKNTSKWKTLKPLLKSYLRSTLFLLNEVTDSEILAFSLTRLRPSIIFFAAFPSLLRRLIKITVHLWATGGGALSSCSFLIIQEVASVFSSDCFDAYLIKTYKTYITHCKFVEPVSIKHIQYLRNSFVELCSLDVQKSCSKALVSIQQLAKILQQGLRTKKKEAVKKICSWQYASCIDLWVGFISANIRDYDLQPFFYMIIQLINGVAYLFPGPRYFPLRLRCIQWLNHLSSSSGIFIPVASLMLDVLEYKIGKEGGKPGKAFNFSSILKLPKQWLKSRDFQEECVYSAIELLSTHFAQWSYHISFPELATIPLIRLRKFQDITSESLRRVVKRLIDQVELNVEFVQKKRDEVAFSPNDDQSVESFLQLEKCTLNAPFTKYYRSVMERAASRNSDMNEKIRSLEKKKSKRQRGQVANKKIDVGGNSERYSEEHDSFVDGGEDNIKGKKRRI